MSGNLPPAVLVLPAVKASLVIATVAAIGAAAAGCGSGSGGNDTRIAIHAVVRAGCAPGGATGSAYPGSIVIAGTQSRRVVRIGGRAVARIDVDPGSYRAGAAWVAGSRLITAHVDGRVARVGSSGLVRFTAPSGADTNLRLVVSLRRTECNSPGAAG